MAGIPPTDAPIFDALTLDPSGPPGNAWGRFGKTDELGMLNLLTPENTVLAAREVMTGIRVSLDWSMNLPEPPSFDRPTLRHEIVNLSKGQELRVVNDDFLSFNTQASTQWDGFRHYGNSKFKKYYNGRSHEDIMKSNIMGMDVWVRAGGIVGRGVFLDFASWAQQNSIELQPFSQQQIPLSQIEQLIQEQDISFRPGDILCIRFGLTAAYNALTRAERTALVNERATPDFFGIESSEATLRFLWKHQFAAVVSDTPAFERSPPAGPHVDQDYILHEWLLAGWGMPIGEQFDLEELSETCKSLKRHTFMFSSVPLKVPGGVASPPNAIALF